VLPVAVADVDVDVDDVAVADVLGEVLRDGGALLRGAELLCVVGALLVAVALECAADAPEVRPGLVRGAAVECDTWLVLPGLMSAGGLVCDVGRASR
jgi:hypothetical protein